MEYLSGHVMTLANSIIGVSILAMPYCFKQCGIVLSTIILLVSSIISRLACHFLLKSAIMARRKTFEFLAFHIFGALGKFSVEIGMIGLLLGTCVAFFVVMGDLGPEIVAEIRGTDSGSAMRTSVLVILAFFFVLPLGLLRNIDSLNGVSKATIGFYCCLVLKIVVKALPHFFIGDWLDNVNLWRPAGILQCLPIFSMALFCQTQIFEIYQAIPNVCLEKMNSLIRIAVNICTCVYIFVGVFGYIAFSKKPFTGNILLSFEPSIMTDVMKIGFVLSLAFSFPLVIFPCRASLYSLLYKENTYTVHEASTNYIPEGKFKSLTFVIVFVSLLIGLMIPNIELVLGLVGSTIGVMICVLFPVTCFICISPKNTNERILAQIMLFAGIIVMVLGTYANLYTLEETSPILMTRKPALAEHSELFSKRAQKDEENLENSKIVNVEIPATVMVFKELPEKLANENIDVKANLKEIRHEPPQPEEPPENAPVSVKPPEGKDTKEIRHEPPQPIEPVENLKSPEKKKDENENVQLKMESVRKNDEVDIEAIKKEEVELKEQETDRKEKEDKNQILIDTIQKQNEMQKEIVEQQKKLIEVIEKQQQNNDENKVNEEKLKAVKQIEIIAKKAIESISGQEKKLEKDNEIKSENEEIKKMDENNLQKNVAAPLSYQLGLNEEGNKQINDEKLEKLVNVAKNEEINEKQKSFVNEEKNNQKIEQNEVKESEVKQINLPPIPIVLSKNKSTNSDKIKEDNKTIEGENIKSIRREILSNPDEKRVKRDVNYPKICEDIIETTEQPMIKMLCKLSDLSLIDMNKLNVENNLLLNNLKEIETK